MKTPAHNRFCNISVRLCSPSILVLAGALVSYVLFIWNTSFNIDGRMYFTLFDDAMIAMRYARNLAEGYGLIWNVGDPPVEGYTNLLWTLWMSFLHLLPVHESKQSLLVMLSGLILLLINILIVKAIAEKISNNSPTATINAQILTAFYYPLIFWTLRGMEVGLLTTLLNLSIILALELQNNFNKNHLYILSIAFILGILTRTDFVIPLIVIACYVLYIVDYEYKKLVFFVLSSAIMLSLLSHILFSWLYYSNPLPNTYYLKLSGATTLTRVSRGLVCFAYLLAINLWPPILIILYYLYHTRRSREPQIILLIAIALSQFLYSIYVGGDAWEWMKYPNRYICIAVPCLLILSSSAIDEICLSANARDFLKYFLVAGGLFPLIAGYYLISRIWMEDSYLSGIYTGFALIIYGLFLLAITLFKGLEKTRLNIYGHGIASKTFLVSITMLVILNLSGIISLAKYKGYHVLDDANMTKLGLEIKRISNEEASIAVVWSGIIPYFSHRKAIDLLGKNDPIIAHVTPHIKFIPGHNKWNYQYSIGVLRPDIILQTWSLSEEDDRYLLSLGYDKLINGIYAQQKNIHINKEAMEKIILGRNPRLPWPSFYEN